ncbi:MAG: OmpA family protein [Candidatus Kapaibacterium sp.]
MRVLLTIACIVCLYLPCVAQDTLPHLRWHVNGGGAFGINNHSTQLNGLEGVPSCCPGYENGTGTGINLQAQWLLPIALHDDLCIGVESAFNQRNGTLKTLEPETMDDDGSVLQGSFEHTIAASIPVLNISAIARMRVWNELQANVGFGFGFVLSPTFIQKEQILSPSSAVFINGSKLRNQRSGSLPLANSLLPSLQLGVSYRISVSTSNKWHLVPSVSYSPTLGNIISSAPWTVQSYRAGIAIEYSYYSVDKLPELPPPPPPVIDTPKVIIAVKTPPPPPPPAKLEVVKPLEIKLTGQNGKPIDTVVVTNVVATTMFAMMNYIFFDSSSAAIAERYTQLDETQAASYRPAQLEGKGTLGIYYNSLNTLGFRLRQSKSKITLIGCNSNSGTEKGNLELSRKRAETIRDYLVNIWKIDTKRIGIVARNLPEVQSNVTTKEGEEENRRVEVQFNDLTLYEPLVFQDTSKTLNNISMGFTADVATEAGVKSWELALTQGAKKLASITGKDSLPHVINQKWDERSIPIPDVGTPLVCKLTIRDNKGTEVTTESQPVTVQQNTVQKFVLKKYSLIVFKFNESDVNSSNQRILDVIKTQIQPTSTVTVRGYTDKYGLEEYNQKLSERRAKEISRLLKLPDTSAQGVGGAEPLYDNATPEGRFYSRTVQITIETPVE